MKHYKIKEDIKKLAVLSDFHGNYIALKAVIAEAERMGCEHFLCCGDYLGYYYEFNHVITSIRALNCTAILGNHDKDFLRLLDGEWQITGDYKTKYGSSLAMALSNLKKENVDWLRALPQTLEVALADKKILLSHGSPWDINEYLYPDMPEQKLRDIFTLKYNIVIIGHSHYQFFKTNKRQIVLNPGSVGQPRDRAGAAAWAMLAMNSDSIDIELKRTEYDINGVVAQVMRFDPEVKYLYEVLNRGEK